MNERTIPRMATLREASELTGLSYGFLRQKALSGEIVAIRAGRKFLVNIDRLISYLNGETLVPESMSNRSTVEPHAGISPIRFK